MDSRLRDEEKTPQEWDLVIDVGRFDAESGAHAPRRQLVPGVREHCHIVPWNDADR